MQGCHISAHGLVWDCLTAAFVEECWSLDSRVAGQVMHCQEERISSMSQSEHSQVVFGRAMLRRQLGAISAPITEEGYGRLAGGLPSSCPFVAARLTNASARFDWQWEGGCTITVDPPDFFCVP